MHPLRRLLTHRRIVVAICAAALIVKLAIPAGFMLDRGVGGIVVTVCSGTAPRTMAIALPGLGDAPSDHGRPASGKSEMPCAFAGLSAPGLGPIDPVQLAALIAFVTALGLTGLVAPPPSRSGRMRPPPIGPPVPL